MYTKGISLVDGPAMVDQEVAGATGADRIGGSSGLAEDGDPLAFMEQEEEVIIGSHEIEASLVVGAQSLGDIV